VAFHPSVPPAVQRVDMLPEVEHVVAVASGKGGVGKSTVAANLAVSLADAGASVGLLDADVYGPNAPSLLGLDDTTPQTTRDATIVPREAHGVRVMSMDFVVGEDDPIIWRGPMVDDVLKQLTGDVEWGSLDYLVVDMPPGTGDAQLTLVQHLPVAGCVVVTTPQSVAVDDARRGLEGFAKYDVPVLGVVENMRGFRCPDCDHVEDVFGAGGADALADEFDIPVLGRVPLDPAVGTLSDDDPGHGVELPVVGRVGLPRTTAEREGRLPPIALRDAGEATRAIRQTATGVVARVHAAAVRDWATTE
jgi:ATP-binding protein involved in chromosome partitioning